MMDNGPGDAVALGRPTGAARRIARRVLHDAARDLPPSYFSLVMATGSVSLASGLVGWTGIARALLALNAVTFCVLWLLNVLRLMRHLHRVMADLRRHAVAPGFFTAVAATGVVGVQVRLLSEDHFLARGLWLFALGLWLVVTCAVLASLITAPSKPTMRQGLNGLWLICVVATQSVAVLGASSAAQFGGSEALVLNVSMVFFMMGCALYLFMIPIFFFRLTFVPLRPEEFGPPYWINMGATAITTGAGATLALGAERSQVIVQTLPFLRGFTIFFWSAGTWWIPILIVLSFWAHGLRRMPLRYDGSYWGMVFPLGMYTTATVQLAHAIEYPTLLLVPHATVYVALCAWSLTFLGLIRYLAKAIRS